MKKFDLQKVLAGAPFQTVNGYIAIDFKWWAHNNTLEVLFDIGHRFYLESGTQQGGVHEEMNLVMSPQKKKLWVAVMKNTLGENSKVHDTSYAFESEDDCKSAMITPNSRIIGFEIDL